MKSHTTVIIPFDDRVIFISLLNCVQFSSPLSEDCPNSPSDLPVSVPGRWQGLASSGFLARSESKQFG